MRPWHSDSCTYFIYTDNSIVPLHGLPMHPSKYIHEIIITVAAQSTALYNVITMAIMIMHVTL